MISAVWRPGSWDCGTSLFILGRLGHTVPQFTTIQNTDDSLTIISPVVNKDLLLFTVFPRPIGRDRDFVAWSFKSHKMLFLNLESLLIIT